MGLYSFLPMWLAVGAGRLSDRIGVRRPMLAGSLGIALGVVLPRVFPGLPALFASTSLIGASFMLFQVAAQHATGALGPPTERAKNFSLLALGYSISGFCGPLLAGFLIDHADYGSTFLVLALLPLVPALVLAHGALALPSPHQPHVRPTPGGIAELLRDRHLRRVFAINALLAMSWDLHSFFIPVYGARIGLSASRIGIILAAFAAATFAVRLLTPWIVRRFTELEVLSSALFVAGCALRHVPVRRQSVASDGAPTLGFAPGSGQPMVMSLLHSLAPAGAHGEAVGVRHVGHQRLDLRDTAAVRRHRVLARHRAGVLAGRRGARRRRLPGAQAVALRLWRGRGQRFSRSTNPLRNVATFGATTNWQYG
jgi:MFS family permease